MFDDWSSSRLRARVVRGFEGPTSGAAREMRVQGGFPESQPAKAVLVAASWAEASTSSCAIKTRSSLCLFGEEQGEGGLGNASRDRVLSTAVKVCFKKTNFSASLPLLLSLFAFWFTAVWPCYCFCVLELPGWVLGSPWFSAVSGSPSAGRG